MSERRKAPSTFHIIQMLAYKIELSTTGMWSQVIVHAMEKLELNKIVHAIAIVVTRNLNSLFRKLFIFNKLLLRVLSLILLLFVCDSKN